MDYHSKGNGLSQVLFRTRDDYLILNVAGRGHTETRPEIPAPLLGPPKAGTPQKPASPKRQTPPFPRISTEIPENGE